MYGSHEEEANYVNYVNKHVPASSNRRKENVKTEESNGENNCLPKEVFPKSSGMVGA